MMMQWHPTRLIVYPLAYLLSTVLVVPVTFVLFKIAWDGLIDPYLMSTAYEGDLTSYHYLALAIALLFFAVPLYAWVSIQLYRWDRTSIFSLQDHLRHCLSLYACFAATLLITTIGYYRELAAGYTRPLGPGSSIVLWLTGCAILANLLALLWQRSRSDGGGEAP
jgi:hypothetical protein